jgi:hypothetical protein
MTDQQTHDVPLSLPAFAASTGSDAPNPGHRRRWVPYCLLALVPVAVVVAAVLVLHMSGALAATGGCGGG